jgi:ADP-heptose:LPS heptosyltransferase
VRFALSLLRALMRVRRERIDTAIDMEGLSSASAIITYLTGASRRVGFYNFTAQGPYRGRLFNRELNYTFQHHVSKTFLALVRAAAAEGEAQQPFLKEAVDDTALAVPRFEPEPEELEQVRALLATRAGSQPHRIVILNPNCSDLLPLRRWPTERFIEVGKQLISEMSDVTLVISGAPSEAEEAARIAVAIGSERVLSLAGHTTMRQLLALYCLSDLLITNDSGPVHFAALTPMRVLALFGPETPKLYGPLGRRARALTADLACSPCVSILNHRISPCSDNRCMQAISTEQVLKAAKELLAS